MLLDRCSKCGMAVAVHRLDMARPDAVDIRPVSYCHACGFDLRYAPRLEPLSYDRQASELLLKSSRVFGATPGGEWDEGRYAVMHQLCRIMTTRYKHVSLRAFVLEQVGVKDIALTGGHISFEMRSIEERHHLLQLAAWLLVDLESRLKAAWRSGSIRYNVLLKDFTDRPDWYVRIVAQFSNWRDRL